MLTIFTFSPFYPPILKTVSLSKAVIMTFGSRITQMFAFSGYLCVHLQITESNSLRVGLRNMLHNKSWDYFYCSLETKLHSQTCPLTYLISCDFITLLSSLWITTHNKCLFYLLLEIPAHRLLFTFFIVSSRGIQLLARIAVWLFRPERRQLQKISWQASQRRDALHPPGSLHSLCTAGSGGSGRPPWLALFFCKSVFLAQCLCLKASLFGVFHRGLA